MRCHDVLLCCLLCAVTESVPIVPLSEHEALQGDDVSADFDKVVIDIRAPVSGSLDQKVVRHSRVSRASRRDHLAPGFSPASGAWPEYSARFQHAWTEFHLETGVVQAEDVPSLGGRSRVLVIGDPCTAGNHLATLVECMEKKLNTTERIPEILSTLSQHVDAVLILGDNFYDTNGVVTAKALSAAQKMNGHLPLLMTVPGNHDFWIEGQPKLKLPWDQLGWGFMQFYGQDTLSLHEAKAYNFTKAEDGLPDAANFFWYNVLGSVGYLGFSGAHGWSEQEWMFRRACAFFAAAASHLSAVFIAGHWSEGNPDSQGCQLHTPTAYERMRQLCPAIGTKLHYVFGHIHCNQPRADGRGFLVGAGGMSHPDCEQDFGFVVVDSPNADGFSVDYFRLASTEPGATYDDVIACLRSAGQYDRCRRRYGTIWKNATMP